MCKSTRCTTDLQPQPVASQCMHIGLSSPLAISWSSSLALVFPVLHQTMCFSGCVVLLNTGGKHSGYYSLNDEFHDLHHKKFHWNKNFMLLTLFQNSDKIVDYVQRGRLVKLAHILVTALSSISTRARMTANFKTSSPQKATTC